MAFFSSPLAQSSPTRWVILEAPIDVTASGDTTLISNADATKEITILYFQISNEAASTNHATVYFKYGTSSTKHFNFALARGAGMNANLMGREVGVGLGTDLKINVSATANIRGHVLYILTT